MTNDNNDNYISPHEECFNRHEQQKAFEEQVKEIEQKKKCLNVITAAELYYKELPPEEIFLSPWLTEGALTMISAGTGIGKTWVANELAKALTTGGAAFNRWNAPIARKVLYIDGEVGERGMQKRVQTLDVKNDNLFYYYRELQTESEASMNIADDKFVEKILATVDTYKVDVVIIDNVFTLYQTGKSSNESESWVIMQDFLLKIRDRGKAVILIDHNSKNRDNQTPLGTSSKEFILNYTILLEHPNGYRKEEGAKFVVHFRKSRDLYGNDVKPFTATLSNGQWQTEDYTDPPRQTGRPQNDTNYHAVVECFNAGITSPKELHEQTGISIATVNRYIKMIRDEIRTGYADKDGYHLDEFDDYQ